MARGSNTAAGSSFAAVVESPMAGVVINLVLIPLLIVVGVLLPPISLADRLLSIGYQPISKDGGAIEDEDGTQLAILSEGMDGAVKIRLKPIPRSVFLEGSGGRALLKAAESIPPNLVMKSPFYEVKLKGNEPTSVIAKVPIPNDSEPYRTLDLYSWNGEKWEWLPSHVVPGEEVIEGDLDRLPDSLVVMQTKPIHPSVSADLVSASSVPEQARDTLVEINPQGLYLQSDGTIGGDPGQLPPIDPTATYIIIPTISNVDATGVVRSDFVDNMLVDLETRDQHIRSIVDLAVRNAYPGIDIDYRNINEELRPEFTNFIIALADSLHANQKMLTVRVALPTQVAQDRWETGVYDWRAIGQAADAVKIPAPRNAEAYKPGGEMEAMLDWATGEISRYKIQLLISTLSREQVDNKTNDLTYDQALIPFGNVMVEGGEPVVAPGQQISFTLSGLQESTGIQFDTASGTYWFAYLDPDGKQRTVWMENAASVARKFQYVAEFNLRGVAVQNFLGQNNDGQIWDVIHKFLDLVIPPVQSQFAVVWTVESSSGAVLRQDTTYLTDAHYTWTAPEEGGEYLIAAAISSDGGLTGSPRGDIRVTVATPTPLPPTPTPTPEAPTPEPTATPKPKASGGGGGGGGAAAAPTPKPQSDVVSTAPNPDFGYGIQVDPQTNPSTNVGHIQALGFGWVKFQMPWKDLEGGGPGPDFGGWDTRIQAYSGSGVKILLSIVKAPGWARPAGYDGSVEGPPQDPATFASFLAQVAERYSGKVQAIEVWNEQNLHYEWGNEPLDAGRFVQLQCAAYNGIKARNSSMIVLSGALTPAGDVGNLAIDDSKYLEQMYQAGVANCADVIGGHGATGSNLPPDADPYNPPPRTTEVFGGPWDTPHHSWGFRALLEKYHNIMCTYGDCDKKIWLTEFGWAVSSSPPAGREYALDNTAQEQAEYTVQAYQIGKSLGYVGAMFLWNLDYGITAQGTELAMWGILQPGGPMPVYSALAGMAK